MIRKTILAGAAALAGLTGIALTAAPAAAASYGFYYNSGPSYYPMYAHPYYGYYPYHRYSYRYYHPYRTYADICGYFWSPHRGVNVRVCYAPGHRPVNW